MLHQDPLVDQTRLESVAVVDVDLTDGADSSVPPFEVAHVTGWWRDIAVGTALVGPSPFLDTDSPLSRDEQLRRYLRNQFRVGIAQAELQASAFPTPWSGPDYTVAICTADRPESLDRCLSSLTNLDPRCSAVIVVDNSRKQAKQVAKVVADHGFDYVREPLPGLDRARNRALQAASTELVLFTDDDVEIDPGWDIWLIDGFRDPLVMATAGLVLPASLTTRSQILSEQFCSHSRGFTPVTYGSHHLFPAHAPRGHLSSPGVGASMGLRRQFLVALGGFPEELDAGMPTGTGGDTWMYKAVLRSGYRVTYQPRSSARHWHRQDDDALQKMFTANARGVWALNWRTLFQDRKPQTALRGIDTATRWHGSNLAATLAKRPGALPTELLKAELVGALTSLRAYRKAQRICENRTPALSRDDAITTPAPWLNLTANPVPSLDSAQQAAGQVSVVIPTRARAEWVSDLAMILLDDPSVGELVVAIDGDVDGTDLQLKSLAAQHPDGHKLKTVVLDPPPNTNPGQGFGAGAARNVGAAAATGQYLLFVDDDVLPLADNLATRHLEAHQAAQRPSLVVGPALVDNRNAVTRGNKDIRNWWVDHAGRLTTEPQLGFTDVCTGNLSMPRSVFEQLGRFPSVPRREDWYLGLRARAGAVDIIPAPNAAALQRDQSQTVDHHDRRSEGEGDAIVISEFPDHARWVTNSLSGSRGVMKLWAELVFRHPQLFSVAENLVGPFSRRVSRTSLLKSRLDQVLSVGSYWTGVKRVVGSGPNPLGRPTPAPPVNQKLELTDHDTPPAAAGGETVSVTFRGHELGTETVFGASRAFPLWRFRQCLIDRYSHEVADLLDSIQTESGAERPKQDAP